MSIIHNGNIEALSDKILADKWKYKEVWGSGEAIKPEYCFFDNCLTAIELLHKHIENRSRVILHADVDMDGVGTTYIMVKFLNYLGVSYTPLIINREKVHGIQKRQVDYININNAADLVIITDSSCNEIDTIKELNCDVLVIDHHDVDRDKEHVDKQGKCNDGVHDFVIVNNTVKNSNLELDKMLLNKYNKPASEIISQFDGDKDMSCGLVVYELLRVYCLCFADEKLLENSRLYQWVGVTLFTDVIDTLNLRNQWYMDHTVFSRELEITLSHTLACLNKFKCTLDKSYIQYTLAPLVNKAIRAGASSEALDIIINNPLSINDLRRFGETQKEAIDKVLTTKYIGEMGIETTAVRRFGQGDILLDITNCGVSPNYTGVIASKLAGENNKNAAVFIVTSDGICEGSFRGRNKDVEYRNYFEDKGVYAQGHSGAFGFKATKEELSKLMIGVRSLEKEVDTRPYITAGNMTPSEYGVYHIQDINEFKSNGYVWKIAIGNAKVTTSDEIYIRVKTEQATLKATRGKLFIYEVLGIECKAFSNITTEYADVYLEYTNEITAYIREVRDKEDK